MQEDVFLAGVRPGGPNSQTEIKTLLCYSLSSVDRPMSFMEIYDALGEQALVNYFELVRALEILCQSGHLERVEDEQIDSLDRYRVTELGRITGEELRSAIPLAVREKALEACHRVMRRQKRESEIHIQILPDDTGGFQMEFSIPDSGTDLIRLSVFAPSQEECDLMKRRFLNAPLLIYQNVMALLTGNPGVLGETCFQEEELF